MTTAVRARRRARTLAAAGAAAALATVLAACGSGSSSGGASSLPAATQSSLNAAVTKLEQPLPAYPVPTQPIANVRSLAGRTLYYIPITQQSPQFAVTQKTLTDAAAAVGMKIQVCDGKGTPTDASACITQATQARAGTIITDAIPYGLASNAFDAAQAAGVPVIVSNQIADTAHPASKTLTYIPAGGSEMDAALAQWVTLDSGGAGNVLVNQSTDGPSPAAFLAAGQQVYGQDCPGCKVTVNQVSSANFSLIPSSTSAALLKNPAATYVESQFEQYLQPTQTGVQQASRSDVKGITGAAQLGGLKQLASGSFLYAAAAQASAYQGWVDADAAMRLMSGAPVPNYTIPVRLFTRDSVKNVQLTEAAQQSGEWFGPATFTGDFLKLWGLQ